MLEWYSGLEWFSGASVFVHVAAFFYVIGFLIRDQLYLRTVILLGTFCYMCYYLFVGDTPLWDAFIWSAVMGSANLYIISLMVLDRTTFAMSDDEKRLFGAFYTMMPGEFRRILKIARWHSAEEKSQLTVEGEPVDALYYIMDGECRIEKSGERFIRPKGTFVGEVAYYLKRTASATVQVPKDSRYIEWRTEDLNRLEKKSPGIRVALNALLNNDMASKVAESRL